MSRLAIAFVIVCCLCSAAQAAVTSQTLHGSQVDLSDLAFPPSLVDLIQGDLPSSASGIGSMNGFRTDPPQTPANEQFPAYTDGLGNLAGLTGLLADNEPPVSGQIIQTVDYALNGARVDEVRVYSGNTSGDARQFSTFVLSLSTNGGATYLPVGPNGGYFQSDPTGTTPGAGEVSTLQRIFDDAGGALATGVDFLRIEFYASGNNTTGASRDPFTGVNPFTGLDDMEPTANQSPLIWEVDVVGVPEPSAAALAWMSVWGLMIIRRRASRR